MRYIIIAILIFIQDTAFSQEERAPIEVTIEMQKKIKQGIIKEIPRFKQSLDKGGYNEAYKEFAVDTFKIERFMTEWMELDYRDFGMRDAIYEGARLYDSLLNKYYKKLLAVLKKEDKTKLIQAQKAWLNFRDNETKLVYTLGKPEYSGGGTIQQLTEVSSYLDMVKSRAYTLFGHFVATIQDE